MKNGAKPFDLAQARRVLAGTSGKRFWSSLEEIVDQAGFRQWLEAEFPSAAAVLAQPARREMLKLMASSLLLAGLGGCGESRSDLALPYVNQPEEIVPGVPRFYASAVFLDGYAQPVLATTHVGRPTKLDGNPEHPAGGGASDPFTQAAVLGLYDPDRSQMPLYNGAPATWAAFERALVQMRQEWLAREGQGLRILSGDVTSPTLVRQLNQLVTALPRARLHFFEPVGAGERDAAMRLAFGRDAEMHYRLDRCDIVVSLDDDILGPGPRQIGQARAWSTRRGEMAPNEGRVIMHVAESAPSLTGALATTRLPCDASRLSLLAQWIAGQLGAVNAPAINLSEQERRWAERAAAALREHAGRSLLAIGAHLPAGIQALAPLVNERLGNSGATLWYSDQIRFIADPPLTLVDLARDISTGSVDTLILLDTNPVYAAPGELGFAQLLARVRDSIHVGLYADETARLSRWHLALTHPLESWSDGRAVDGSTTIVQPLVAPLYSSRTVHQVLDLVLGIPERTADAAVRDTWTSTFGENFEQRWRQSLHAGFVADTAARPVPVTARVPELPAGTEVAQGQTEFVFRPDPSVWDGRFANNGWLQELPKPLSKLTWDNVIAVSPALAERLGLANGDMVESVIGERRISGPAWIMPGQAANTVTLFLGYGRGDVGKIANAIGYSAYAVRPATDPWFATGTLRRLEGHYELAATQLHHRMEGYDFVREVSVEHPSLGTRLEPEPDLYPPWPYPQQAWGMAIDLDLCIGCNACIAACTAENNVAVVGKEQVAVGREMQWLRVDRYYSGSPEEPRSYFQPVPCMHCEKAPCEMGCPVHATVHSPEGINQMVYNRCIGTRTCSSFCPYKVRRFNWFDYRAPENSSLHAAANPAVTVRSRGVMEKCTYCIQRIQAAQVSADKEGRRIREGEVVTACQQACPTSAIVFGNLNDPNSAVAKRRHSGRHYLLLEELGTRPRTSYLARWDDSPKTDAS
jgi:MoCo/4Fe-4S cofactor protein with predicted Tat translocation signal